MTNAGMLISLLEWCYLKICLILSGQPEHLLSLFVFCCTITGNSQSGGNSEMILPEMVTGWAGWQSPPYSSPLPGFWFLPPNASGIWRWFWLSRGPWRGRFWLSLTSVGDFWIHWQEHHLGPPLTPRTLSQNGTTLCFSELYLHQTVSAIMKDKKRNPQIFLDTCQCLSHWTADLAAERRNHACIQQSAPACSASIVLWSKTKVPMCLKGWEVIV